MHAVVNKLTHTTTTLVLIPFLFLLTEPTEDWTVEHVMQWCLLQSHQMTDNKHKEQITVLDQQMEEAKNELWSCHEQVVATTLGDQGEHENIDPNRSNSKSISNSDNKRNGGKSSATKKDPPKKKSGVTIHIAITNGAYAGKTFVLSPAPNRPCWVGRGTGKKFKAKGMSLSKDPEVSTTHGKFEAKGGKAFFTDTGSTNGTLYKGNELEDNVPLELKHGMVLQIGGAILTIQLELSS